MKTTFIQALRFGIVGLTSNALGFFLYLLMTGQGLGHKLSMTLLFAIGTLQTFIFNKRWSFEYRHRDRAVILRYLAVYALGYLINLASLVILVDHGRYPHAVVQGILILVVAALMFLLQKYWVFPAPVHTLTTQESVR